MPDHRLDLQAVLEFVCMHIATQGEPGMEDGLCLHRTNRGLSCPIGAMLPDDIAAGADDFGEGIRDNDPVVEYLNTATGAPLTDSDWIFLSQLQMCHDLAAAQHKGRAFIRECSRRLQTLASVYKLRYPEELL